MPKCLGGLADPLGPNQVVERLATDPSAPGYLGEKRNRISGFLMLPVYQQPMADLGLTQPAFHWIIETFRQAP